jgi:integrase
MVREWEAAGEKTAPEATPITIHQAWEQFLHDATARGLRPPTLYKYRLLSRQMQGFGQNQGLRYMSEFDLPICRAFRASWPHQNLTALKTLERLRAFFRFAQESGWISENPARKLKNPRVTHTPTLPFTREEMTRILAACDAYAQTRAGSGNAARLRALVLLLRYSGLRIRDGVTLCRDRIVDAKLFLYTAKTGTAVYCPLPEAVMRALEAIPTTSREYFFWTGESEPKSAVGDWQRSLRKLFALAKVMHGHAHRFRDTFAVELLLARVPLERVSVLLGHQSTRITEKHYSPWVRARQEQLEADVRSSWAADLVAESATKGTSEVHEKQKLVN